MLTIQLIFFSLFLGCSKDAHCTSENCFTGNIPQEIYQWITNSSPPIYDYGTCFNFNGGYKIEITNLEGILQIYSMSNDTAEHIATQFKINEKYIKIYSITKDTVFKSYHPVNRTWEIITYCIILCVICCCISCKKTHFTYDYYETIHSTNPYRSNNLHQQQTQQQLDRLHELRHSTEISKLKLKHIKETERFKMKMKQLEKENNDLKSTINEQRQEPPPAYEEKIINEEL